MGVVHIVMPRRGLFRKRRDERGFTAAELVVGVTIMLALVGGALVFLETASKSVRAASSETESLDHARTTLATMSKEVRGALAIHSASTECPLSTCLIITVQKASSTTQVRYRYVSQTAKLLRSEGDALTGVWGAEAVAATSVRNGTAPLFTRNVGRTIGTAAAIQVVLDINVDASKPSQVVRLNSILTPRNL